MIGLLIKRMCMFQVMEAAFSQEGKKVVTLKRY